MHSTRWLIASLVLVGCGDTPVSSEIVVYPGPVATATQGALLQLAARVEPVGAEVKLDLAMDPVLAERFSYAMVDSLGDGSIVSLIPDCHATIGTVTLTLGADGYTPVPLTIDIAADPGGGMCAGAIEHAITKTYPQLAMLPDPGRELYVRATLATDAMNERVRVADAHPGTWVSSEQPKIQIWPTIGAPSSIGLTLETAACSPQGCDVDMKPLTSVPLSVDVTSPSELLDLDGDPNDSVACIDLGGDATPELVITYVAPSGSIKTFENVGAAGHFTTNATSHVTGLLGFTRKTATGTEPVLLGMRSGTLARAQVTDNALAWTDAPSGFPQLSTTVLRPIGPTTDAATYLAERVDYAVAQTTGSRYDLHCISPGCVGQERSITLGTDVKTVSVADVDGDGNLDLVVTYGDGTQNALHPVLHVATIILTWGMGANHDAIMSAGTLSLVASVEDGGARDIVAIPHDTRDWIYVLARDLVELKPSPADSATYTTSAIFTVGETVGIGAVDRIENGAPHRTLAVATSLGIYTYEYDDVMTADGVVLAPEWQQQDPQVAEDSSGQILVDNSGVKYGIAFVPCVSATGMTSVAFQTARGHFEWTQVDLKVDQF